MHPHYYLKFIDQKKKFKQVSQNTDPKGQKSSTTRNISENTASSRHDSSPCHTEHPYLKCCLKHELTLSRNS